ncbi:MAG: hypothetical protein VX257_12215 [Planctomycetota bacterium]|nr:hypothetical protein [Planctomycetota bacterium]
MASLVKQLDAAIAVANKKIDNPRSQMAAVVNLIDISEDEAAVFLKKTNSKNIAFTLVDQKNADRFNVSEEADLTVMHYLRKAVKANHALATGKLDKKAIKAIVKSTSKILE